MRTAKWKIYPPDYLKMDAFEHEGFGYVKVPEGSEIKFELELEPFLKM